MSNELQLSNDLNVITAEINSYKQVAGQAIFEIGRRLKWVKENDLVHGEFGKWLDKINMSQSQANRFMTVVNKLDGNFLTTRNLGVEVLYYIATLPEEEREKTHTIPSTGETKTVDEMTVRELREVKRALKDAEDEKKRLAQLLTEERNKPSKVETKVLEKEVDKTDYNSINKLNKQIQTLQEQLDLSNRKQKVLNDKLELEQKDAAEYRKMKDEIQRLHQQKDDLHRQIESATEISGLVVEIEHLLQNKLAPLKYSRAMNEQRYNDVVVSNVKEIIDRVFDWCSEMEGLLPRKDVKIIDAEIIESN